MGFLPRESFASLPDSHPGCVSLCGGHWSTGRTEISFRAVVLDLRQRTVRTTSTLPVLASLVELAASPLTPCLAPEQVGTAIEQKGAAE